MYRFIAALEDIALRRDASRDRMLVFCIVAVVVLVAIAYIIAGLRPVSSSIDAREVTVHIPVGMGLRGIGEILDMSGVVRSPAVFQIAAVFRGDAHRLKAGLYILRTDANIPAILDILVTGAAREVEVTIPEGSTSFDIDAILAARGILPPGAFTAHLRVLSRPIEGRLFPDTYRFYTGANPNDVLEKFLTNFSAKAEPLLTNSNNAERDLILASLLEKEVPSPADRRVVAGVLKKRVASGMPLQVDAAICYVKELTAGRAVDCLPFSSLDFETDSPYNTYLQRGWPPGPIGNPGLSAIQAALSPVPSSYWYYLSDPATQRTIFSTTFDEHRANKTRYLKP